MPCKRHVPFVGTLSKDQAQMLYLSGLCERQRVREKCSRDIDIYDSPKYESGAANNHPADRSGDGAAAGVDSVWGHRGCHPIYARCGVQTIETDLMDIPTNGVCFQKHRRDQRDAALPPLLPDLFFLRRKSVAISRHFHNPCRRFFVDSVTQHGGEQFHFVWAP